VKGNRTALDLLHPGPLAQGSGLKLGWLVHLEIGPDHLSRGQSCLLILQPVCAVAVS
jgi:hypothetical protein